MFVLSCEKETKSEELSFDGIEIGRVINGDPIFTYDVATLKRQWASQINRSPDLNIKLTFISIEENKDGMFLYGEDEINNTKSRFDLAMDNNIIYYPHTNNSRSVGCTTTCSGCTSTRSGSRGECSPIGLGNQTYCSSCSQGTCSKSVSCGNFF